MFRHNLLITYRSFLRNKSSFIINLIGLSTGLACALMIYLWVIDEMRIDTFLEKDEQLYQVMKNRQSSQGILTRESTPELLAEALMQEMPEIAAAVRVNGRDEEPKGILKYGDRHLETKGLFASKNYFDVFSYKLLKGNKQEVLAYKNQIVISQSLALKLFNSTEDIVGKTLAWETQFFDTTFQITGVFQNPPQNASEQFELVANYDLLYDWIKQDDIQAGGWNSNYARTYIALQAGTNPNRFNKKIADYLVSKDSSRQGNTLFIQRYSEKYLFGQYENGKPSKGRITYVRLFLALALFILLIACINFMNLSTAQASKKMKEIGIKKTIGAHRVDLVKQFLSASILMTFIAMFLAILWVQLFLPQFNMLTGKTLQLSLDPRLIFSVVCLLLFTGLIAGSYPAFYLSGFNPVKVLNGKLTSFLGEKWIRKSLVVFQFSLAVIFIVAVLVINQQMEFALTKNLGYTRDNILTFQIKEERRNPATFLEELRTLTGVEEVSNMFESILNITAAGAGYTWNGEEGEEEIRFKSPMIGYDLVETLGMKMLEGRSFSRSFSDEPSKIILNETALNAMQLQNPIGKKIRQINTDLEIIGVVEDFQYGSIHQKVEPLIFRFNPAGADVLVKIKSGKERATVQAVEKKFKEFYPEYTFEFTFMDSDYQKLYASESRVSSLSKYFAGLAIIISCLGLLGLSIFTTEQRKKEIGIRKVLGSSVFGIVHMLTRDFTKTILLGIVISLPISYLIAREWLSNFAYRIELGIWSFLLPGICVLILAWITVGAQTLQAARLRPVHSLRDE